MTELTARAKAFRAAIAGFIEARRDTKLKGKEDDADAASKYEYGTWLADAAARAHNLQLVTHPIKFTHSGIKGASSVHAGATGSANHREIGTHSISVLEEDFAITDSKHLDIYSLLKEVFEGKRILDWLREEDVDLESALDPDPEKASALMKSLRVVFRADNSIVSHPLAKQTYWLVDENQILEDCGFHLLQPMFSSSLEHAVNQDIRAVREEAFSARGTRKQKATLTAHSTYPGLVARTLGGSNAQNVSPQNKARGGINYLLPSLPPAAWNPRGINLLKRATVFDDNGGPLLAFGGMRELVRALADFLKKNPDPTMETRKRREIIEQAIGWELAMFGTELRGSQTAGWTRSDDCELPLCERLWLDPDRTTLPVRNDPEHPHWQDEDLEFNDAYELGDWPDEIAERFGLWLNHQLRKRGGDALVSLGWEEMRHFAQQAILDVAWPIPLQRRAQAGAA